MAVPTRGAEQIFDAILKTFAKVEYDSIDPDPDLVFSPDKKECESIEVRAGEDKSPVEHKRSK